MRVLIDMGHPAHVHFFRHAIALLQERGHQVLVTVQPKEVMLDLLDAFQIPYELVHNANLPPLLRPLKVAVRDLRLLGALRRFSPDVVTAIAGMWAAHAAFLNGQPCVVWDDTEHHKWGHRACWPFATAIYSPDCYTLPKAPKQHFYAGTHDLAYLHPSRFTPDAEVVRAVGIDPDQPYCIVRLVSWRAVHDIGQHGFDLAQMVAFMQALEAHAFPYITSEGDLPAELRRYQLNIPAHHIHHVMAHARLCVGEGGSMMTESAALGTPAVLVNTLQAGVFEEFKRFGLLKQTTSTDEALAMCLAWLTDPTTKETCRAARDRYLLDRIDVTTLIVDTLQKYASLKGRRHLSPTLFAR